MSQRPQVEPRPRLVGPALVAATVAISFAAIFFRKAAPTHPLVAAGVRLAIAAVLLAPAAVRARRRGKLRAPAVRAAIWGGVAYAVHFGTWVWSLSLTKVAAAVTLVTATPILLAAWGALTDNDAPTRAQLAAMLVASAGLLIVGGADVVNPDALVGDALAFCGAAAMAVYMLLFRRHASTTDSWAFSAVATGVGAVLLLGTAAAIGVPIRFAGWEPFGFVVLATLFPQLVGHGLVTWSLRRTRPVVVGIATLGEPVGATLLAWWLLGERAGAWTLVGCAVTLLGVAWAVWSTRSRSPDDRIGGPSETGGEDRATHADNADRG